MGGEIGRRGSQLSCPDGGYIARTLRDESEAVVRVAPSFRVQVPAHVLEINLLVALHLVLFKCGPVLKPEP